ncbi:transcription termination/antitermination protein NusG [Sulfitobacter geojensis]|uniref:transcription termination/antitermination protein NusG n=1 Tax=Sulfitobacter geojensis TaxID=1342299 RepID=UPI0036D8118C
MTNPEITQELPWFVVQLRPHGLKRALEHLQRQNFPTFAPMFEKTVVRSGTSRQTRAPLFPGYIFVSFEHEDARWTSINSTRGVSRIISPTPLPKQLIGGIMARCDESGLLAPPATLAVGDEIRVISGPFAEIITAIETLPDQARIGVLIDLMRQKVRTSLPRDQIEKL